MGVPEQYQTLAFPVPEVNVARISASRTAATLALLISATTTVAAERYYPPAIRGEAPPASHVDATGDGPQVGDGEPMNPALWQVQVYSTYEFTEEEKRADKALPRKDPRKLFLDELFPWELSHRCGGVYIGDMWVLTAAHCVAKIRPVSDVLNLRRVRVGAIDLNEDGGTTLRVERAVIHSHYSGSPWNQRYDIALLKIAADKDTDQQIAAQLKPIRILGDFPGDKLLTKMDKVWVSGWGLTDARAYGALPLKSDNQLMHASPVLLKTELIHFPHSRCTAIPEFRALIGPSVICAGSDMEGRDACQGDSGGPLVRKPEDAPDTDALLVGLVSVGKGCGTAGVPGIYTNVSYFRNWIADAKKSPAGRVSRR